MPKSRRKRESYKMSNSMVDRKVLEIRVKGLSLHYERNLDAAFMKTQTLQKMKDCLTIR